MRTAQSNNFISTDENGLRQAIRTNSALADISNVLSNNTGSLTELSNAVLAYLLRYFECSYGAVLIHNHEEDVLELTSELGDDSAHPRQLSIKPGETITGNVFILGETKYLEDVPTDYLYKISSGSGTLSASYIVILPLKFNNTVAGIVELASFTPFEEDDIIVAERVCGTIAATMLNLQSSFENARLVEKLKLVQQKSAIRMEEQYASMQRLMNEIIERHKKREQELLDEIEKLKQKS